MAASASPSSAVPIRENGPSLPPGSGLTLARFDLQLPGVSHVLESARWKTQRMRILHAVFTSRIAGSERYCIDLAIRQAALGHEVHVAGPASTGFGAALGQAATFHPIGPFRRGWRLRRLAQSLEPDICHGHLSVACKAFAHGSCCARAIATLHMDYKKRQHARLAGLVCVNRSQPPHLSAYRGRSITVGNWLPALPEPQPGAIELRRELGIARDAFVIGAAGRLQEVKGMDVLVEAFRATAPSWAALVIMGEGKERRRLERLRADDSRIFLPGHRASVRSCLSEFDLFVSPSRSETFGLAIVEAMHEGLPIICTATAGPAEFLRHQPVVFVRPGSVEAMTEALKMACARFQVGALPRIRYEADEFEPGPRVERILDFYSQVIAARQACSADGALR